MKKIIAVAALALLSTSAFAAGSYAGFGVGSTVLSAGDLSPNLGEYRAFAGYDFNSYLGVEGAYTNLGVGAKGGEVTAHVGLPLGPVKVFAKGGEAYIGGGAHYTYGAGVQLPVTQHFAVKAEAQKYQDLDGYVTTLSAVHHF